VEYPIGAAIIAKNSLRAKSSSFGRNDIAGVKQSYFKINYTLRYYVFLKPFLSFMKDSFAFGEQDLSFLFSILSPKLDKSGLYIASIVRSSTTYCGYRYGRLGETP